jgi:putative copper export protein
MKAQSTTLVPLVLLLASGTALAHPGHGATDPEGLVHYLTEPVHVVALAAAAGAAAVAAFFWTGRRRRVRNDGSTER